MSEQSTNTLDPTDWLNENVMKKNPMIVMCPVCREDVHLLLKEWGIPRRGGEPKYYSLAKMQIVKGKMIDHEEYDRVIGWILEYLN
jgi:hypothetical protein